MASGKAVIGVSDVHYALMTAGSDSTSATPTYAAAVAMAGVTEIAINPNGSVVTLFADNGPAITANTIGEIEVSMSVADLTPAERLALLGHNAAGGVVSYADDDISPDVAIGFQTLLSDGTVGYVWLLKGKFVANEEKFATKKEGIEFQVPSLSGKFTCLIFDGKYKRTTRSDDPNYVAGTGTAWYTAGPLGAADAAAPTVTVVPADAEGAFDKTANVVWTFNEAIQSTDMTGANFFVMKDDGTAIAGALSIDTDHKIVTFNPTNALDATTDYIAICTTGVHDLVGNALAAINVSNFKTGA